MSHRTDACPRTRFHVGDYVRTIAGPDQPDYDVGIVTDNRVDGVYGRCRVMWTIAGEAYTEDGTNLLPSTEREHVVARASAAAKRDD